MKKVVYSFLAMILFLSCEDVVEVDLATSQERLVVNASLNWFRDYPQNTMQMGNFQTITLTRTAGFYDEITPASDAIVTVTNKETQEIFNFFEEENTGIYKCSNFKPILNNTYSLHIIDGDQTYIAEETLIDTPVIDGIQQVKGGFFDDDQIILKVYYTDDASETNYYYFDYIASISEIKELSVSSDRFSNGNQTYETISYFNEDEDIKLQDGDIFDIKFFEISAAYYQFLNVLTDQIYTSGIFDPVPAEVKGNIINTTDENNYPYGYFRVAVGNKTSVVIDEDQIIED
jgi:hypothetical protein